MAQARVGDSLAAAEVETLERGQLGNGLQAGVGDEGGAYLQLFQRRTGHQRLDLGVCDGA